MKKLFLGFLVLIGLGLTFGGSTVASAATSNTAAYNAAVAKLNQLRATQRHDIKQKGDGNKVGALKLDGDLTKWAQTRANELAKQNTGRLYLSHADLKNGQPKWSVNSLFKSPKYVAGKVAYGPEALLASTRKDITPTVAVQLWWNEYYTGAEAYGHYLTLSSPYANHIGFGIAKAKNGATIVVAEMAYR